MGALYTSVSATEMMFSFRPAWVVPLNARDTDAGRSAAMRLADEAVAALVDEAILTPKPGLVDLRNRSAHHDLTWELMCRSARVLHPVFMGCAEAAHVPQGAGVLREQIGAIGRQGEHTMLAATGGVNTHRGAIWAVGLLVTAAALTMRQTRAEPLCAEQIAAQAGALARLPDRFAPQITGNKGEAARCRYAVGGAKGQAEAGFPHVIDVALPVLRQTRQRCAAENSARLDALLAVMAVLDDTCILARGGADGLRYVQTGAAQVLALGGSGTDAGRAAFSAFEAGMLERCLSPGGAADLLAAALFLDRIEAGALDYTGG